MKNDPVQIDLTIESVNKALENYKKIVQKMNELKFTLIRRRRALDETFWFDNIKTHKERLHAVQVEALMYEMSYGVRPEWARELLPRDLSKNGRFYCTKENEWKRDKEQVLKENKQ
jgi:hypothetical protein